MVGRPLEKFVFCEDVSGLGVSHAELGHRLKEGALGHFVTYHKVSIINKLSRSN
jgi:hypothetical protein